MPHLTRAEIDAQLERLPYLRASCAACHGNPDTCRNGTTDGHRLPGCHAFTGTGQVRQAPKAQVKQPWDVGHSEAA